jgi:hypothetical protein
MLEISTLIMKDKEMRDVLIDTVLKEESGPDKFTYIALLKQVES